ncbi:uncharacterized protein DFL_009318 [Arthrobotrys flagrans]|uniref:Uncharacterized protein n=1 Tax=Arthrobotrys flagrans TaxID=97331 RepID=A0A436ZRC4_ARTFL|nr:hypothetical protein DFL_009318 [Arthrobotrys flagrans]
MQQSPTLRRTPGGRNLREQISKPRTTSGELCKKVARIIGDRAPHEIIEHSRPESLLELLSCLISLKSGELDEEKDNLPLLREFFEFAERCRRTANTGKSIRSLPCQTARHYSTLLGKFEEIIQQEYTSLDALRFIFKEELGVEEGSDDTRKLVLLVLGDLPFNVANWTNLWVGLIHGLWGGIWQTTLFVRRLRDGKVLGKKMEWMPVRAREMQWAKWQIGQRAGERDVGGLNPRREGSLGGSGLVHQPPHGSRIGRREREDQMPKVEALKIETPVPVTAPNRKESPEIIPAGFPMRPPPTSIGKRRVPERERRPKVIHYSPSPPAKLKPTLNSSPRRPPPPEPKPSKIDEIIGKYAQLPRLKYDKEAQMREQLARQQRSEEEFNVQLRKKYQEERLKERLDKIAKETGMLGEWGSVALHGRPDSDDEAVKIKKAGTVYELNELHRRVLEQDKELEDTSFEKWAGELLAEGIEEEEGGD